MPAQVAIASADLAVGRQRFAFGLLDAYGGPIEGADAELQFFQLKGEIAEPFAEVPALFQRSDLAPSGLYITYIDFPEAGTRGVEIRARLEDGREAPSQRVRFDVAARSDMLGIGETPLDPRVYADEMTSWRLVTEPWVFVLDRQGTVAERLEGGLTAAELDEVLQRIAGSTPWCRPVTWSRFGHFETTATVRSERIDLVGGHHAGYVIP